MATNAQVAKPISRDAKHIMQLNSFLALVERQPKEFETTLIALRKLMDCKLGSRARIGIFGMGRSVS